MGILYIVATPIGNLGDITLRALETLKNASVVFAEDTRVTQKLLGHYEIKKSLVSLHEHSDQRKLEEVVLRLKRGESVAYVTDAGTPGISDPGGRLVAFVRQELPNARIVPIPGVTALSTLLSVAGCDTHAFTFLGYPPQKKGRKTFFAGLINISAWPIVLYESPYRVGKTLLEIQSVFGDEACVLIGRELTKKFEQVFTGTVSEARGAFTNPKGEFVIVIL